MFETIIRGFFSSFVLDILGILGVISTGIYDLTSIHISTSAFYVLIIAGFLTKRYIKQKEDSNMARDNSIYKK